MGVDDTVAGTKPIAVRKKKSGLDMGKNQTGEVDAAPTSMQLR